MRKIIISLILLNLSAPANEINFSGGDIFPMHQEMQPAVRFWIKIYAQYNTNQYVLHDSRHLEIVYEIQKVGELIPGNDDAPLTKRQKDFLKSRTKFYKDILNGIATVYPDSTKMTADQLAVFRQLNRFQNKKEFYDAARRIRVQKGQRNKFRQGLEVSGRYMPFLKKIFNEYNLPQELTILPHVESSFNYKAYSSAGAAGIWQFTRGTGKRFLKISYEVDERLDPLLATEAAAKLLQQNYQALGSWPLAITAYNHGLQGMKRAVKKLKTKDMNTIIKHYRSRYFKFASRNFYCEFIAALHVVQNYEKYFGFIAFEAPIDYQEFALARYLKYETLAGYLDMDNALFRKYNPALRPSVYNNNKYIPKGYIVRLPNHISVDSLAQAIPHTAYLDNQKRSEYYRIRYGDTLSDIARRFGTSVETLLAINNLSNAHYIRRGMTIRIPDKKESSRLLAKAEKKPVSPARPPEEAKNEESLVLVPFWQQEYPPAHISKTADKAIFKNGINEDDLEIEFLQKSNPAIGYIRVEPEETLGHYAEWLQVRTQQVRNWNNLSFTTPIHLSQKIKLVFDTISPDDFNRFRLEYHRGIEEDFFLNFEITGTTTHTVKSGDNIWYLCNYEFNLPYWLIVDFNKDVDFEALNPGDELIIPAVRSRG